MEITQSIIDDFRSHERAFNSTADWPRDIVTDALYEADAETGGKNWGAYQFEPASIKARGMFLYAAHLLISTYPLGAKDQTAVNAATQSIVSSKSVADESVSFAVPADVGTSGNAWLASTQFGQRFMRLRRRVGMGAIAL